MTTSPSSPTSSSANYVKMVHRQLRCDMQGLPITSQLDLWKTHVAKERLLDAYAFHMTNLDVKQWRLTLNYSRTLWIRDTLIQLLVHQQIEKHLQRLLRKYGRVQQREDRQLHDDHGHDHADPHCDHVARGPFQLLDVGACHNPLCTSREANTELFLKHFEVTAIDLWPSTTLESTHQVHKLDFVSAPFDEEALDKERIRLRSNSMDVVVFCLLLEYLPTSSLRFEALSRAVKVLRSQGILVVVTPDSCHVARNQTIWRLWKIAFARMGLVRIRHEKFKHFHGMVFVKVDADHFGYNVAKDEAERMGCNLLCDLDPLLQELLLIPQGGQEEQVGHTDVHSDQPLGADQVVQVLQELPFASCTH